MKRVAVIGGGTMGNGIAQVFATAGDEVVLIDVDESSLARARNAIAASLGRLIRKGALSASDQDGVLARIRGATDPEAARGVALAIEAVVEDRAVKEDVFRRLDGILSHDAILATNTSSLSITELAAVTERPDRVIGMHFMNPVPVMTLVEVIRGLATSDGTVERVEAWSRELGKTPVEVQDYPGFVSNRVLMPMINEAVYCLMEGVATREAIDQVMKLGMNHPLGPLALADLIGLDVCLHIMEVLHDGYGDSKYRPCPLLRKMVAAGRLGRKSGRGFYDYD